MPDWIKYIALFAAIGLPLFLFVVLLRRPNANSWQHYGLLIIVATYCSVLFLGVSGYLTSFGYGDARMEFIDRKVTEAQEILKRIEELRADVELTSAVASARNGDRLAFDRLKDLSKVATTPRSTRAATEVQNLIASQQAILPTLDGSGFNIRNPDCRMISIDEVKRRFAKCDQNDRFFWIQILGDYNEDTTWRQTTKMKLEFLIKVMKEDPSLQNVYLAQNCFRRIVKDPALDLVPPYLIEDFVVWWAKNQDRYK